MTSRSIRRVLAVATLPSILLAACGGDDQASEVGETRAVTDADFAPEWVLSEFKIGGDLVVAEGEISASVTNVGVIEHNVGIEGGPKSSNLAANEETTLVVGSLAPGSYILYCDVDGHRASGMEATLTVVEIVDGEITVPAGPT